jgi:3-hydroxyisobutyrate dehydrogenase-like beta-hydroxyacid dehydrogenase
VSRVALVGLGEVGRVFVEELRGHGIDDLVAWDTAFATAGSRASANAAELGVDRAGGAAEAASGADLVVSAVTAANAVSAAGSVCPGLAPGTWFFDLNSCSPGHKSASAQLVEAAGGRYVEAALMSPIEPRRLASQFLLGGPHARAFAAVAGEWGLTSATAYSDVVGRAAATKLCRSVVVKGLESLFTESLLSARAYGVEREVLDSLSNILPAADWERLAAYFIDRSLQHGVRRAEEMREAAATVAEAGVDPFMSDAIVRRQEWAAQHAGARGDDDLGATLDRILGRIRAGSPASPHQEDLA